MIVPPLQITRGALLFDDQDPRPEEVDVSVAFAQLSDMRLVARDLPPLNAEDIEEIVVEASHLALRVRRIPPVRGESRRSGPDLVPRQAYVLHAFPVETVLVDPLDLATIPGAHTNVVQDH